MRIPSLLVVVPFALAACKFPELPPLDEIDAAPGDGQGVDADNTDARPPKTTAVAIGTDYAMPSTAATLGAVDIASVTLTPNVAPQATLANDPIVRFLGDEVLLVNRYVGGNVVILDPDDWSVQFNGITGANTNPQDVAVVGTKLFVPALATNGLRVLDRANPGTIRSIDLSALDTDGRPDCTSAYAVGNTVIVACGILDASFQPRGNGQIVYIDASTETIMNVQAMPVPNPVGLLQPTPPGGPLGGDILIGSADYSPPNDGCLVRVHTTPTAPSCLVSNAMITDNASAMAPSVNGAVVYILANGVLRQYDVLGSSISGGGVPGNMYNSLAACPDDTILLGQTGAGTGIRAFRNTVELTTSPLDLGKPPAYGNSISCFRR